MATVYPRCTACMGMHEPGACRLKRQPVGVLPAPAVAPPARAAAPVRKPAQRPAPATLAALAAGEKPQAKPAPVPVQADASGMLAVMLPRDVVARATALAGSRPVAEWIADTVRAATPPLTSAERVRNHRARKRGATKGVTS